MKIEEEIKQIDIVISQLKSLKSDLLKVEKLSDKSFNTNTQNNTPKQIEKASTNLNFACMELDKQRKRTWKSIKDAAFLNVSLEECEYHPSPFHSYK